VCAVKACNFEHANQARRRGVIRTYQNSLNVMVSVVKGQAGQLVMVSSGPECLPDFMQVVLWLPLTRWQKVPQAKTSVQ
jgi:hypothetical protein